MKSRSKVSRSLRSWAVANIIIEHNLYNDFSIWCSQHPKIKSKYRAANLFLIHKKMRYADVREPISGLNMDSITEFVKKHKCIICPYFKNHQECADAHSFGYCPLMDAEEDYSTAVYREIKEQNGEF